MVGQISNDAINALVLRGATPSSSGQGLVLKAGQVLQAEVLTQTQQSLVSLKLGGQVVQARTHIAFNPGQQLTVKVANLGSTVVLQLAQAPSRASVISEQLRSLLPKQESYSKLLANVGKLAGEPSPLSPKLQQAIRALEQGLSDLKTVSHPQGLRQALRDSGVFLESKLQQNVLGQSKEALNLQRDFKAGLLKILAALPAKTAQNTAKQQPVSQTPTPQAENKMDQLGKQPSGRTPTQALNAALGRENVQHTPGSKSHTSTSTAQAPAKIPQAPTPSDDPTQTQHTDQRQTHHSTKSNRDPLQAYVGKSTVEQGVAPRQVTPPLRGQLPQAQAASAPSVQETMTRDQLLQELRQQLAGSLARLQLGQLASVAPDTQSPTLSWLVDLPIKQGERTDVVQFLIEKEPHETEEEQPESARWSVTVAFDLAHLGAMKVRIGVQNDTVSTLFWAERAQTQAELTPHFSELSDNLQLAGLHVEQMQLIDQLPSVQRDDPTDNTLDVRA